MCGNETEKVLDIRSYADYFVKSAFDGMTGIVTNLLDQGIGVDCATTDGCTALMAAANQGHKEILEVLLNKGASIDKRNPDGLSALMIAASEGRTEAVKFLLERNADVNAKTEHGVTALMLAALEPHPEMLEILRDHGADMHARTTQGDDLMNFLHRNPITFTEFARRGDLEAVTRFLDNGIDPDVTTSEPDNYTALMAAAAFGQVEVLQLLLERGASLDKQNSEGLTALMFAAYQGELEAVKFLIGHGGNINDEAWDGTTLLMLATATGKHETVRFLLEAGADPNAKDEDGLTALDMALEREDLELLEVLRAHDGIVKNDRSGTLGSHSLPRPLSTPKSRGARIAVRSNLIEIIHRLCEDSRERT